MTYFVQLRLGHEVLGAGFLINRAWAVTANHCVDGVDESDELDLVSVEDESLLTGRIEERSEKRDLAVIRVVSPTRGRKVPAVDRAVDGAAWQSPYRPSKEDPILAGSVQKASIVYSCEAGGQIAHGMQLRTDSELRNFSGYSGSPVERVGAGVTRPALVGLLIEQNPDRLNPEIASNILWAASMKEIISAFGFLFDQQFQKFLGQELYIATEPSVDPSDIANRTRIATRNAVYALSAFYEEIDNLSQDPDATLEALSTARAQIPKSIIDSEFGGNPR